ncbi:MAG: hypothetical protein K4571_20645 [Deltaproteobacteria bacterium]
MKKLLAICAVLFIWAGWAAAAPAGDAIEVSITSDQGAVLPLYPRTIRPALKKVYVEAVKGDHYRIIVRNKLNRRVGIVAAVDGRNIISGEKSWLKHTESMYILEPYATHEYSGWRTAQDIINRFYFTDVPDSYAAAFGDESAMGVIAVAAYPEIQPCRPPADHSFFRPEKHEREAGKDKAGAASVQSRAGESAGTGYGREEYSPSRRVSFDPESRAVESVFIKYEWRRTLCDLKIIRCGRPPAHPQNRIWDNDGFAPPPPCRP